MRAGLYDGAEWYFLLWTGSTNSGVFPWDILYFRQIPTTRLFEYKSRGINPARGHGSLSRIGLHEADMQFSISNYAIGWSSNDGPPCPDNYMAAAKVHEASQPLLGQLLHPSTAPPASRFNPSSFPKKTRPA